MSSEFDLSEQHRQTADYVDRILKGESPADLPVQVPTAYQPIINVTAAKAVSLTVSNKRPSLVGQVIECGTDGYGACCEA